MLAQSIITLPVEQLLNTVFYAEKQAIGRSRLKVSQDDEPEPIGETSIL